jgi:hypothetical protein
LYNLLIVKNFLSEGLITLENEASIPVDLSSDQHFFNRQGQSFSRGTLINTSNFISESDSPEKTPLQNKSTQDDEEHEDDNYNYDGGAFNPFASKK